MKKLLIIIVYAFLVLPSICMQTPKLSSATCSKYTHIIPCVREGSGHCWTFPALEKFHCKLFLIDKEIWNVAKILMFCCKDNLLQFNDQTLPVDICGIILGYMSKFAQPCLVCDFSRITRFSSTPYILLTKVLDANLFITAIKIILPVIHADYEAVLTPLSKFIASSQHLNMFSLKIEHTWPYYLPGRLYESLMQNRSITSFDFQRVRMNGFLGDLTARCCEFSNIRRLTLDVDGHYSWIATNPITFNFVQTHKSTLEAITINVLDDKDMSSFPNILLALEGSPCLQEIHLNLVDFSIDISKSLCRLILKTPSLNKIGFHAAEIEQPVNALHATAIIDSLSKFMQRFLKITLHLPENILQLIFTNLSSLKYPAIKHSVEVSLTAFVPKKRKYLSNFLLSYQSLSKLSISNCKNITKMLSDKLKIFELHVDNVYHYSSHLISYIERNKTIQKLSINFIHTSGWEKIKESWIKNSRNIENLSANWIDVDNKAKPLAL